MNSVFNFYLLILAFSPLVFGIVEAWSLAVMEGACCIVLLVWLLARRKEPVLTVPGLIPFLLFLGYLLFQILPLPTVIVKFLSPNTFQIYQGTFGILDMPNWLSLSVEPHSTISEFFRFAAYGCFYVLTIQLLSHPQRFCKTIYFVVILGFVIALFALIQKYVPNGKIYWLRSAPEGVNFFGPYIYRNHFAGFMEMIVPLAISLFFYFKPRVSYAKTVREKVVAFFDRPQGNLHFLSGFAGIVMAASVFSSLSRGGSISCGISVLFLLLVFYRQEKKRAGLIFALAFVCCLVIAIQWLDWDSLSGRFARIKFQNGELNLVRPQYWRDCLLMIRDFPVFGTGFGTFANIFPSYRSLTGDFFLYHAHNDYLETLSDGGFLAILLIVCFWLSIFLPSYKKIIKRRDTFCTKVFWGSTAGMLALLIHSVSDFNFQSGANALYFFLLAGVMVSAAHTRIQGKNTISLLPQYSSKTMSSLGGVVVFCLLCSTILFQGGRLMADSLEAQISTSIWGRKANLDDIKEANRLAVRAAIYDPLNSYYAFLTAYTFNRLGNTFGADQQYRRAVRLNPLQSTYLQDFGLFLAKQDKIVLGERFLLAGVQHDRSDSDRLRRYALWLIDEQKQLIKGLEIYRQVMSIDPNSAVDDIDYLDKAGYSDSLIKQTLPDRVRPLLEFAQIVLKQNNLVMAENAFREALDYVDNETGSVAYAYQKVYVFFVKQNRYADALGIIQQGVSFEPDHIGLRFSAASLYEKMQLTMKAKNEYKAILTIAPQNKRARQRLTALSL